MKNLTNLENLLNQIWTGKLLHNQRAYEIKRNGKKICCLAGWTLNVYVPQEHQVKQKKPNQWERVELDYWGIAQEYYQLSLTESRLLFSPHATKALHKKVLQAFKNGKQIDMENDILVETDGFLNVPDYQADVVIRTASEEDLQSLATFLGVDSPTYEHIYINGEISF